VDASGQLLRAALPMVLESGSSGLADALAMAALVGELTDAATDPGSSGATASEGTGSAGAVHPGEDATEPDDRGEPEPVAAGALRWYWILHDDSAPEPGCLAQLLEGADRNHAAHILIPKTVAWSDRGQLVGVGNRWAPGHPVVDRLEFRERDQGQYDVDRPVYVGSSAGMLVRADTWAMLGGIDPQYGDWAGTADLCRRVWGTGCDVTFIPQAVVAHRQAGQRGVRRGAQSRHAPRRAARHGQLLLELTQAPALAVPWRWLRGWVSTFVRALALLLTREIDEAAAEVAGAWDALGHPVRIRSGRRALRRAPVRGDTRPAHVRATRGAVLGHSWDAWTAATRDPDRPRTGWRLPRSTWQPLAVAAVLAAAALVREPGQVFGSGTLRGGGLLPAPGGWDLLTGYLASWQDTRFGAPTVLPAYLPLLAAASAPLLGSVDLLLRVLVGLAVPLAFLSAYASIGPILVGRHRTALALAWSLLPAGVAAMSGGRLSTVALLLLGPPTARLIVRALQHARANGPGIRPAVAAGVLLGTLAAFAPLAYLLVALAGLVAWLTLRPAAGVVRAGVLIAAVSGLFLALWAPRALLAPWLLLSDLGRTDPTLSDPGPWVWGLAAGGPTSVAWAGVPLLLVALLAVVVLTPTARMLTALLVALALLAVVAWQGAVVGALWSGQEAAALWPGQPLVLASGLLALLLARVASRRGRGEQLVSAALLGCVGVLALGWWVAPVDALVGSASALPPVVSVDSESVEQPRALVLARSGAAVRYGVATGPQARLGDADALAAPADDPAFARDVQALVSGAAGDLEGDLGGRGIRYVVFNGGQDDPLVAELDAAVGLRRLASSSTQSLWLVSGQAVRAELTGRTDDPDVVVPVRTRPTTIDVVVHPEALLPRNLAVAEQADPGWGASIDGQALALGADARGMVAGVLTRTGELHLAHRGPWPYLAVGQLVLMAVAVVLALPKRRSLLDTDQDSQG
jgi:GT2 family glycosyltransferase